MVVPKATFVFFKITCSPQTNTSTNAVVKHKADVMRCTVTKYNYHEKWTKADLNSTREVNLSWMVRELPAREMKKMLKCSCGTHWITCWQLRVSEEMKAKWDFQKWIWGMMVLLSAHCQTWQCYYRHYTIRCWRAVFS